MSIFTSTLIDSFYFVEKVNGSATKTSSRIPRSFIYVAMVVMGVVLIYILNIWIRYWDSPDRISRDL